MLDKDSRAGRVHGARGESASDNRRRSKDENRDPAAKVVKVPVNTRITVEASYPDLGRLNLAFTPPIQTWRFPGHVREHEGRAAALDACRDAVRRQSAESGTDAPIAQIKAAVEAALLPLVESGSITLP
jgi:hypothetical protein